MHFFILKRKGSAVFERDFFVLVNDDFMEYKFGKMLFASTSFVNRLWCFDRDMSMFQKKIYHVQ